MDPEKDGDANDETIEKGHRVFATLIFPKDTDIIVERVWKCARSMATNHVFL